MFENKQLVKTIENKESFTKVYNNGYVENLIRKGANLDVPYLIGEKKILLKTGIKEFYIIFESEGFYELTRNARILWASREFSEHLGAVAIVANNYFIKIHSKMFLKVNKPTVPTKIFENKGQAKSWLIGRIRKGK